MGAKLATLKTLPSPLICLRHEAERPNDFLGPTIAILIIAPRIYLSGPLAAIYDTSRSDLQPLRNERNKQHVAAEQPTL